MCVVSLAVKSALSVKALRRRVANCFGIVNVGAVCGYDGVAVVPVVAAGCAAGAMS